MLKYALNPKFGPNLTKIEAVRSLPFLAWVSPNFADRQHLADWNRLWPQTISILVQSGPNFRFRAYLYTGFSRSHATSIFQEVKWPNDYTCPGHIHWGLVCFAVMFVFNGRSRPRGHWWWIKSQSGTWKFNFHYEDLILSRWFNAYLGIESPNWIKGRPPPGPGVTDYNPGQSREASQPFIKFVSKLIGLPDQFCF